MAENLIGGVTAKVTSDNTQFDASWKQSQKIVETAGEQITATYAMNSKAAEKAAEAQAFAAKFAGEAVSEESQRMIALMKQEGQARADFRKAQSMARTDFQGEAEAANLVAAAYQRLTAATEARKAALEGLGQSDKVAAAAVANTRITSIVPTAGVDAASQQVAAATMAETAAKTALKEITDSLAVSTLDEETKQKALAVAQGMVRDATRARMEAEAELKTRIDQTSEAMERQLREAEANKAIQDRLNGVQASPTAQRVASVGPAAAVDAASQQVAAATMAETAAKDELKKVTDALAVSTLDEEAKQKALAGAQGMVRDATRARMEAETELKARIDQTSEALERQLREAEANKAIQDRINGVQTSPAAQRIATATLENAAAQKALRETQDMVAASSLSEEAKISALGPALQRARLATIELAEANDALASTSHHVVSGQQAASASIRSLEGNAGLRAVENFIAKTLGLGPALQAIFPIVGAIAFGQILLEIAKSTVELEQKAVHAAEAIGQAFEDLHEKAQVTNDDLAVQNDKLQDEIDKLSGHPNNGLQTALDEARKMADRLLESLQADRKELEALLKEHEVGAMGSMLSSLAHVAPTSTTSKQSEELLRDQKELKAAIQKADDAFNDATAGVSDKDALKAATDRRNEQVRQAFQSQIDAYHAEAARLRKEQSDSERRAEMASEMGAQGTGLKGDGPVNNSAKVANIEGRTQQLQDALRRETLIESIAQREQTEGALKQGKEAAGAVSHVAADRLKAMEAALNQEKIQFSMSTKAEYDYWTARQDAFVEGSDQYDAILNKRTALAVQGAQKAMETIKAFRKQQIELAKGAPVGDPSLGWKRQDAQAQESRFDTSNEIYAIEQRTQAQLAEMAVREQVGRTLTEEAAAMELAAIHTHAYGAELERLEAKRQALTDNPLLSNGEADQQRRIDELNRRIAELQSGREIEIAQDTYAVKNADQSAVRGATDALNEFRLSAQDTARQMHELTSAIMNGVHAQLLDAVTGQKTDMRGLGRNVATGVADMGLKKLESNAMEAMRPMLEKMGLGGLFGNKKRDGSTESAALYVQIASAHKLPGSGGSDELSKMLGLGLPGVPEYKNGGEQDGGSSGLLAAVGKIFGGGKSESSSTGGKSGGGGGVLASIFSMFGGGGKSGASGSDGSGSDGSDGSGGSGVDSLISGLSGLTGSMFGGGKNGDGSSPSSPLYVQVVGGGGAGAGGAGGLSSMLSMFGGGDSGGGDSSGGGGGLGSIIGSLAGAAFGLPGFANGVEDFAGGPAIVGEQGPEIVNLPRGASVVPNQKAFGGGHTVHNNIEMNVHGDPSPDTLNQLRTEMKAYSNAVGAQTLHAIVEGPKRRPPTARG